MKHLVIPDTQVKPNCPTDHLRWAGLYAVDKKPDVIIHIGDHFDMPSLSSWDVGKKSFEGRRYMDDIEAGISAMHLFMDPIKKEQKRLKHQKKKQWNPRLIYTLGNHENRIKRAIESDSKLEGLIGYKDLELESFGFEVYDYLEVVVVNGIAYSHFFTSGVMGRPVASARSLVTKKMMSCVMGHVQDCDIAFGRRADGKNVLGLFSGIFYQHDEEYLTHQTNGSWRGVWMLHEVDDGNCDEMKVSMRYLKQKYQNK